MKRISKHVAVSSGSACSSTIIEPSHVLTAMGLNRKQANSSIRFSFGRPTTESDIELILEHLYKGLNI
jgi:cysteine desulfurase